MQTEGAIEAQNEQLVGHCIQLVTFELCCNNV